MSRSGKVCPLVSHRSRVSAHSEAEKRLITDRTNGTQTQQEAEAQASVPELTQAKPVVAAVDASIPAEQREFEDKYAALADQEGYRRYSAAYTEKAEQQKKYLTSVKQNTDYFRQMRGMIKAEADAEKRDKMKHEFRQIFNQRKAGIKQMRQEAKKLSFELVVIKKRINAFVAFATKSDSSSV